METISIDIETFSDVNLAECGVYKYAQSPDFEILLFGYSVDGGAIHVVDLANCEKIPDKILKALSDDSVIKWAFNANFERICLSEYLNRYYPEYFQSYSINEDTVNDYLDPASWRCTMIWSAYLGLPLSLKGVGAVLKLDAQKMDEGKELIKYFCVPCVPTKANGGRLRNYPHHDPEKWELFKKYNKRDVEVELAIKKKLTRFPVPEFVWEEYHLDQQINDRGIAVDMELVSQAVRLDEKCRAESLERAGELTRLDNPNSPIQLLDWLDTQGVHAESLDKKTVQELLKTATGKVREVLLLRQQLSKSSVKKYTAMNNVACDDSRARGCFQFYGANRTGRWSGRNIQLQNLPQNHIPDLEQARNLVKSGNYEALDILYNNIPDTLSQLIRTAFVPRKNMKFIVADFSAIEARVIAWLAGERWRMEAFADGKDIYCASASQMFHVPVEKHGVNGHLRQKGKIAELACGYGGASGAMKAMGADAMGLSDNELKQIVADWREASPNIVKLWWDVDHAVKECIRLRLPTETHGLKFSYESGFLFIELHSGRRLAYVKPRIEPNQFGGESVTYEGVGTTKKWERLESYGPKFVENCIAKGTIVITDKGFVRIEDITAEMKVWDGVEFVSHDGLIIRGMKETISVNGINMTPEHKILTEKGWIECGKACGFNWTDVSLPDSFRESLEQQARKSTLAMPMHMRKYSNCRFEKFKRQKISCKIMWLYEIFLDKCCKKNTWHESSSGLGGMAFDETTLFRPESPSLSQLWRKGNNCLSALARRIREFLGGYGGYMAKRAGYRQNRQQQRIQSRKLSLDNQKGKYPKQEKQSNCKYTIRRNDYSGVVGKNRDWRDNTLLSYSTRMERQVVVGKTGLKEYVYDIRNCGPRHRFAVWNGNRAYIVSNCVQGIARDLLCHSMKTLSSCFMVATVHDEIIIEADKRMSLETVCKQMSRTPPWADGLLLRADGYECEFYRKD